MNLGPTLIFASCVIHLPTDVAYQSGVGVGYGALPKSGA